MPFQAPGRRSIQFFLLFTQVDALILHSFPYFILCRPFFLELPKKSKSGYYLAINFAKFTATKTKPAITKVRFGWLDLTDWVGQNAASGQQARLELSADRFKLLEIHLKR
jgi:hypothetical protein